MAKLRVKQHSGIALEVNRLAVQQEKLVYVLLTNRKLTYAYGKSYVAYIGTTKKGASRIMQSAAKKAGELLAMHGVTRLTARIITCHKRQNVKTWRKLERALLLEFRAMFGTVPKGNNHGKGIREQDEFDYFQRTRIMSILKALG